MEFSDISNGMVVYVNHQINHEDYVDADFMSESLFDFVKDRLGKPYVVVGIDDDDETIGLRPDFDFDSDELADAFSDCECGDGLKYIWLHASDLMPHSDLFIPNIALDDLFKVV